MSNPALLLTEDSFAALLRRQRLAAGLTQETLAERAGLSDRAVSALERGVNHQPRLETVQLLATALDLTPLQRAAFLAAARPESRPAPPPPLPTPTGTLTFLLTDLEGSTALWEQQEALMRAVLPRHDALLDACLAQHGGRRIKERGEGDATFAVFADPTAAIAAALAIQRALLAEPWPQETPIRVRMGLHTGIAQLHGGDYYGPAVNRAARLRELGHGGQVLLAEATAALVEGRLPEGTSLRELGRHSLQGIGEAQRVYQFCHPDLPAEFPPLRSSQAPKHNLPAALSSFIGRAGERGAVLAALGVSRLVTLVGAGGVGKTRLALAVAESQLAAYPEGVWLVELAGLEGALVAGAVAGAVGVREEPGRGLLATLTDQLRDKHLLLVLDNCEHLVAASAGLVEALLRGCPQLRILATSREGLGVAGERLYRVPGLPVPDPAALPSLEELGQVAAVRLFVERAGARAAGFALAAGNAGVVAGICRRLEGIPLAIELAAGRVGGLPLATIAERLEQGLGVLTGGPRTAATRQQTLRGALDWSWALLGEPERILLRRLSVFAGGWGLAAAEAVCAGQGLEVREVVDLLGTLVDKSLALLEEGDGAEWRYRLLEPVRQYASERLQAAGEAAVRGRHLAWCVALAEEAEPLLTGPEQGRRLVLLEREHDNLRAALGWARACGTWEPGLRLTGALWRFWTIRGHLSEGRGWLREVLDHCHGAEVPTTLRVRVLLGAGNLAHLQGDYSGARALHQESLDLARDLGDKPSIANALHGLGDVAIVQADYADARLLYEESLSLYRETSNSWGVANSLHSLAAIAHNQGDYPRARVLYQESLTLKRRLGDRARIAITLNNLGNLAQRQGDDVEAQALLEECLALARELGDRRGIAASLDNLGNLAFSQGYYARARALLEESLALNRAQGDRRGITTCLDILGNMAYAQGDDAEARARLEESLTLKRQLGDRQGTAYTLNNLGKVVHSQGDHVGAQARCEESLALYRSLSSSWGVANSLDGFARIAVGQGQPRRAAQLWGAIEAMRQAIGIPRPPNERDEYDIALLKLRAALGDEAFDSAWAAGQAVALEEAIALALAPAPTG